MTVSQKLEKYQYRWPLKDFKNIEQWTINSNHRFYERTMPENCQEVAIDSRWPAFFPSCVSLVTTSDGVKTAVERSIGATIVNRFPYTIALSFCKKNISERHYDRSILTEMIENSGVVAVHFFLPGQAFDKILGAVNDLPEKDINQRINYSGLSIRQAKTNKAPVFTDAYMVYEAALVKPGKDFNGSPIHQKPWLDTGSHRVYFFEINAIQLRKDIAEGDSQVHWRSLPTWQPNSDNLGFTTTDDKLIQNKKYQKGYAANYYFPSSKTTTFKYDCIENDMAVKHLAPLPEDQVEIDNDRARWPCFFPSSLSLVTTWAEKGIPNVMPCGSTMVVSRHPMIIAICVAYAAINIRYSPRATLDIIRRTGTFGCGVPYVSENIIKAIKYTGNVSVLEDSKKVQNAGLEYESTECSPTISSLPIHFDCRVVNEIKLGTHSMFLGEVSKIRVRTDVLLSNPLEWFPMVGMKV